MQTTHMATPVLEVAHLEKVYGALGNVTRALNDVSFTVNRGEFVGIMGASGSGKSTFLNLIGGLEDADGGSIMVDGCDLTALKPADLGEYRRRELGFVFQFYNLVPNLTALENVELAAQICPDSLDAEQTLRQVGLGEQIEGMVKELYAGNGAVRKTLHKYVVAR